MIPQYFEIKAHNLDEFDVYIDRLYGRTREIKCDGCNCFVHRPLVDKELSASVKYPRKKWPDIIDTFTAREVVVSQKVLDDLHLAGLDDFTAREVVLIGDTIKKQKLGSFSDWQKERELGLGPWISNEGWLHPKLDEFKRLSNPRYWLIEPKNLIKFDPVTPEDLSPWICKRCGRFDFTNYCKQTGNKDGLDCVLTSMPKGRFSFAKVVRLGDVTRFACPPVIIDIARECGWSNFAFMTSVKKLGEFRIRHKQEDWREILENTVRQREIDLLETSSPVATPVVLSATPLSGQTHDVTAVDMETLSRQPRLYNIGIRESESEKILPKTTFGYWMSYEWGKCSVCGSVANGLRVETLTVEVKHPERPWPDILRYWECPTWAISDQVAEDLASHGITGYKLHALTFEGRSKKLPKQHYHLLEPTGSARFEPVLDPELLKFRCPACGRLDTSAIYKLRDNTHPRYRFSLVVGSYSGDDFVRALFSNQRTKFLCSGRVVDLANKCGWTNACFEVAWDDRYWKEGEYFCVDYSLADWRDKLDRDISVRESELRGDCKAAPPKPFKVIFPKTENLLPEISSHPFDNFSAFDGTAWQATVDLPCVFGLGEIVVYEDDKAEFDVDDNADYLPMSGQRKLFDFFAAKQEALLPSLRDCLVKTLMHGKEPLPSVDTAFPDLAQWLEAGGPEIKNAGRGGCGVVTLYYTVKETDAVITVEVACNPAKNDVKVKSCEIA